MPELEAALRRCRADVDEARAGVSELRQAIERSAAHRRAAEQAIEVATRRRERLLGEGDALQAPGAAEIEGVRLALVTAEAQEQQARERLADVDAAWRSADAARAPAQQALRDADARLARIEARLTALRQLQERAQSRTRIGPWLERHGLDGLERLWKRLRIEEGWETAVESLLRERVEALEIGQLDHLSGLLADAPPAKVSFHTPQALADAPAPVPGLRPLLALVRVNDAGLHSVLAEWLHGCHAAADLEQALAQRQSLPPGGRLVTPQGHVVGRLSLQFHAPDSEQEGVLARQHELEQLAREQRAQQLMSDDSRAAATRAEALAAERLAVLSEARQAHEDATRQLSARRMDAQRAEQQLERASHARERIATELADADEAIESARFTVEEESAAFDRHDAQLAERQQRVEDLLLALEQAEQVLNQHREALRQAEREAQACAFSIREIRGRSERLEAQAAQARQRAEQAQTERAQVEARLGTLSDDAARAALDEALDRRHQEEAALSAARQRLEGLTHDLRALDEQRLLVERDQAPLRERVTALQLEEQAARLSAEQFAQQLAEAQVDEQAVRAAFADTPRAPWLQGEITRLGNAIAALGAVNLAALDELSAASERKGFLDAQSADLNQAIATLEDAIRRIDRETRALLQQTYDTVNQAFGRLFPELFGGGEARLILTGDEILDAGVQVMAQPPGKRNTSIHLLSGGEKALTAIALVFAMFQLNPAPFCLLDEVDAPLDDANTERYADMVRRMSDQTQFVFITHNKIAMEMAEQLVGVTMQERGVSRIVAVDLEAASRMAEAA